MLHEEVALFSTALAMDSSCGFSGSRFGRIHDGNKRSGGGVCAHLVCPSSVAGPR